MEVKERLRRDESLATDRDQTAQYYYYFIRKILVIRLSKSISKVKHESSTSQQHISN